MATDASPRTYLTNESSKTLHIDSGARSTWRGAPAAVTACGRFLENFSATVTPDDAKRICGQCAKRRTPVTVEVSSGVR